jgi:hypothetical protein
VQSDVLVEVLDSEGPAGVSSAVGEGRERQGEVVVVLVNQQTSCTVIGTAVCEGEI